MAVAVDTRNATIVLEEAPSLSWRRALTPLGDAARRGLVFLHSVANIGNPRYGFDNSELVLDAQSQGVELATALRPLPSLLSHQWEVRSAFLRGYQSVISEVMAEQYPYDDQHKINTGLRPVSSVLFDADGRAGFNRGVTWENPEPFLAVDCRGKTYEREGYVLGLAVSAIRDFGVTIHPGTIPVNTEEYGHFMAGLTAQFREPVHEGGAEALVAQSFYQEGLRVIVESKQVREHLVRTRRKNPLDLQAFTPEQRMVAFGRLLDTIA